MSLILQIETATTVCSVALAQNGELLAVKEVKERNVHAEMITLFIQDVCAMAGKQLKDIDAVAVSKGPGSYTGLRIGVSTAKGICFGLDKPLIAVDTLAAMATGAATFAGEYDSNAILCPMIDARRMEVYTAMFTTTGELVRPTAAEIIDDNSFAELPSEQQLVIFGDGAEKCIQALAHRGKLAFLSQFENSASQLTQLAAQKFANKEFEDVAYFEPYYLKEFIAGVKGAK
ncbi:tRNA (adenosine(37)-N6)-threonylcarbamoyltransferase complex dimerization subunit type 1 TsaB [Mucilaginibacter agri]|uniref:tRNA (Adenosine(37)-N6)-threonylcarbamoyltransferase complex dimerization subunit type 1 TsaB n=1 Tax=Mucilaginibacter agri TaxID=2695265 RepID=A0A965ZFM7_9SPHI|nr:tRNA (adenosine(37)-N6)-threonylcarbamoyltransferase complex dimerization subunit type 1 TsaB [Mucilaginibacter agri]NCD68912.1 tRNA (adenosine(37)-N6)-threonylcarbamoyltransferase complex dimerization subunit type 1 TsaB [Mucilaginibacter agri]